MWPVSWSGHPRVHPPRTSTQSRLVQPRRRSPGPEPQRRAGAEASWRCGLRSAPPSLSLPPFTFIFPQRPKGGTGNSLPSSGEGVAARWRNAALKSQTDPETLPPVPVLPAQHQPPGSPGNANSKSFGSLSSALRLSAPPLRTTPSRSRLGQVPANRGVVGKPKEVTNKYFNHG